MGNQEKHEIIGRLVSDRAHAKEELELIRTDLYFRGQALCRIGERLSHYAFSDAAIAVHEHKTSCAGDLDKISDRLTEYEQLAEQIRNYDGQLKGLGIGS